MMQCSPPLHAFSPADGWHTASAGHHDQGLQQARLYSGCADAKGHAATCAVPPLRGPTWLVADMLAPHAMTSAG